MLIGSFLSNAILQYVKESFQFKVSEVSLLIP